MTQNTEQSNNARLAKNTIILYIRMGVTIIVNLFISRIILNTFGESDFGIYNIVAGVIVLFSFINSAMTTSTQRYLSFAIGEGFMGKVQKIFSLSLIIHIGIALLIVVLGETAGYYFLNFYLNIPAERMFAANWVYQLTIFSAVLAILRVPYSAVIISFEKFNFFAYANILESILKLVAALLLTLINQDKLIAYAILIAAAHCIILASYHFYCHAKLDICKFKFTWNKKLFHDLSSFSFWSMFGGAANLGNNQGLNMIMNKYCGVGINASMGLASQVNAALYGFISSFQTAFNPQLTKYYAAGNHRQFINLIFQSSKISFYLLFFLSLPIMLNSEFVLKIWLKTVPEYTSCFLIFILLYALIDAVSGPLWYSVQATGNIRNYQIIVSSLIFFNIPLAIILFHLGFSPVYILFGRCIVNAFITLWRIFYLKNKIDFPCILFIKDVIFRIIFVAGFSIILPLVSRQYLSEWRGLFTSSILSCICILFGVWLWGLSHEEKKIIYSIIKSKK